MTSLDLFIVVIAMIISFILGAKINYHSKRDENIEINPIKKIKEIKEENEFNEKYKKDQEIYNTVLSNIDNYDGSSVGQKNLPK